MIGDDIMITVVAIKGDCVRIGVSAPVQIPVHRSEVYDRVQQEGSRKRQSVERNIPKL